MTGPARIPLELRLSGILFAVGGPLYLVQRVVLGLVNGGTGPLWFPGFLALLEIGLAAALLRRLPWARIVALVVAGLVALLHLLIMLGGGPVWTVTLSGLLAAAHVYTGVLLNTGPARGLSSGGHA